MVVVVVVVVIVDIDVDIVAICTSERRFDYWNSLNFDQFRQCKYNLAAYLVSVCIISLTKLFPTLKKSKMIDKMKKPRSQILER